MKPIMCFAWKGGFFESRDETARLLRAWRRDKRMTLRRLAPYHYRIEGAGAVAFIYLYGGKQ